MQSQLNGINDDITSRKSSKFSMNNDQINIRHKKSSLLTIASLQNRKKSSLKSDGQSTPRPPPRKSHTYQPRLVHMNNLNAVIGLEEKDIIDTDRDNSSAMYMNYHHNPIEIEGNETRGYRL